MKLPVYHTKRIIFTIVASLFAAPLFAQFDFPSLDGASASMGGASVALQNREYHSFELSSLASASRSCITLSVRQNYLMEGTGYAALAFSMPVAKGAWAASFVNYGNSNYSEQLTTLMYGLPIAQSLSLGAAIHYLRSSTSDPFYDPVNRLTFSVALQYFPTELLVIGFKAFNPIAIVAESDDAVRVPALFALGVSYWLRDELLAIAEVEKNIYNKASLRFGLQYVFMDDYFLRLGLNSCPLIYSFGLGMMKEHLGTDLAVQLHQVLGLTPQLSLHYSF